MLGYTGGAPREQTQQASEELRERDNLWTNTFIGDQCGVQQVQGDFIAAFVTR